MDSKRWKVLGFPLFYYETVDHNNAFPCEIMNQVCELLLFILVEHNIIS